MASAAGFISNERTNTCATNWCTKKCEELRVIYPQLRANQSNCTMERRTNAVIFNTHKRVFQANSFTLMLATNENSRQLKFGTQRKMGGKSDTVRYMYIYNTIQTHIGNESPFFIKETFEKHRETYWCNATPSDFSVWKLWTLSAHTKICTYNATLKSL